ncbi:MAG: alpha/beta hydrolase fold domain-containing protein [Opitutales bacterium]
MLRHNCIHRPARAYAIQPAIICLISLFCFLPASFGETVLFGDGNWEAQGVVHRESSTQTAVVVQDGLTFTLTITLPSSKIGVDDDGELNVNGRQIWGSADDPFTFSIDVAGTGLEALSFSALTISRLDLSDAEVSVSESVSANTRMLSGATTVVASDLYEGLDSLTPLNETNTSSWDITVSNTGTRSLGGIVSLAFDYTLSTDPLVTLSAAELVADDGTAVVDVSFNQPVTDLTGSDFEIGNGEVADFVGEGDAYTLSITPTGEVGEFITIALPTGSTIPSNFESDTLQIEILKGASGTLFLDKVFRYFPPFVEDPDKAQHDEYVPGKTPEEDDIEEIKNSIVYGKGLVRVDNPDTPEVETEYYQDLYLDMYRPIANPFSPALPNRLPAFVFIHGGGWEKGNKNVQSIRNFCYGFAQRGYVTVSIQYRYNSDQYNPPNETQDGPTSVLSSYAAVAARDAAKAIRWLRQNADAYRIDPNRIGVGGLSAGATTALAVGFAEQNDYRFDDEEIFNPEEDVSLEVTGILSHMGSMGFNYGIIRANNFNEIDSDDPPALLVHGDRDNTVPFDEFALYTESALDSRNHPYSFLIGPGYSHAFNYSDFNDEYPGYRNQPSVTPDKTIEDHCFEFFFEHFNLAELLAESPDALSFTGELNDGEDTFKASIIQDERIDFQLESSNELQVWDPVLEAPVVRDNTLEVELPTSATDTFFRWEVSMDYTEVSESDYP